MDYFASQHVGNAVIENRNELIGAMVEMAGKYMNKSFAAEGIMEDGSFHISRLLANTCSMFRSFLDHSDRYFVTEFGKLSAEYSSWKEAVSKEYDENINYKLMYMMRNYIQHYDMPPLSISLGEKSSEDGLSMRVDLDLLEMSRDASVVSKIKKSEISGSSEISLFTVLNSWDESFFRISTFVRTRRLSGMRKSAEYIRNIRHKEGVASYGKLSVISLSNTDTRPEELTLNFDWLPEEKARLICDEIGEIFGSAEAYTQNQNA